AKDEQVADGGAGEPDQVVRFAGDQTAREAACGTGGGGRRRIRRLHLRDQRWIERHTAIVREFHEAGGEFGIGGRQRSADFARGDGTAERAVEPAVGELARIVLRQQERMRLEAARADRERRDRAGNRNAQRQCDSRSAGQNESLLRLSRAQSGTARLRRQDAPAAKLSVRRALAPSVSPQMPKSPYRTDNCNSRLP